ncbi:hypothetical protein AQZ52_03855 [Novosphingobium fuchskuhlense]|uniref:NIPSNAP domain-containing protein n=1 Tax=Novosphingobium fuchskuhlense TaxID=1117702 RepID=A0A117UX09_9SPHN|nr:hypothetical protein [Novosphingobium fuchskuhlense]KUR72405.1 hypothetical protein AQZ52_03855 [Novosphingobium fuchskuhlense]
MKSLRLAAMAAVALACAAPVAVSAQQYPVVPGDYVSVSMISVDDGHDLDYINHLAGMWRKGQDFAVKQGWITGYEILTNEFKRPGEPDYYLITRFAKFADPAEEQKREDAYTSYMATTNAQLQSASADRAKYRTQMGSILMRSWKWRN